MIVCEKARLTYTAVPKNACTSMKCFFYHVNTGQDFAQATSKPHRGYQGIHHLDGYRMHRFRAGDYAAYRGMEHAAIIRDPLDRFRSAFRNRLFQYNDIESQPQARNKADQAGLPVRPDLGVFVDRLDDYLDLSRVILFHLRPAHFFLGPDLGLYDHVFPIERTEEFCALVRQRSACQVGAVRANESQPQTEPDYRLTPGQFDKLSRYLASDYDYLADHYAPRSYDDLPPGLRTD